MYMLNIEEKLFNDATLEFSHPPPSAHFQAKKVRGNFSILNRYTPFFSNLVTPEKFVNISCIAYGIFTRDLPIINKEK